MSRLAVLTVVTALLAPAPAARAVPPVLVSGTGYISPGLAIPGGIYPVSIWFRGTGQVPGGGTYACELTGSGDNVPMGGASGFLTGSCGPIAYPSCVFELSPATWEIACTNGSAGSLAVTYDHPTSVRSFTATGLVT